MPNEAKTVVLFLERICEAFSFLLSRVQFLVWLYKVCVRAMGHPELGMIGGLGLGEGECGLSAV